MAKHYLKARHLMLDSETLDTTPTAAVLSVAAVSFTLTPDVTIHNTRCWFPSLREQLVSLRRTVSADTQEWWAKQTKDAKDEVVATTDDTCARVMHMLADFAAEEEPDYVWAQGASFDFPILQGLARQVVPHLTLWPFWIERDSRTILGLPEGGVDRVEIAMKNDLVAHRAIDDCLIQVHALAEALRGR